MKSGTRAELREQIEERALKWNFLLLGQDELDVETLKVVHKMNVDMERLRLCALKVEGVGGARGFTAEETIKGIDAMMGKGSEE